VDGRNSGRERHSSIRAGWGLLPPTQVGISGRFCHALPKKQSGASGPEFRRMPLFSMASVRPPRGLGGHRAAASSRPYIKTRAFGFQMRVFCGRQSFRVMESLFNYGLPRDLSVSVFGTPLEPAGRKNLAGPARNSAEKTLGELCWLRESKEGGRIRRRRTHEATLY